MLPSHQPRCPAQSGSITVDGVALRDLNVAWWREHLSLVQQEPTLW